MSPYYIASETNLQLLQRMGSPFFQLQNEDIASLVLTSPNEIQIFDKFSVSPIYQFCFNADKIFTDHELACVLNLPANNETASALSSEEYTDLALLYFEKFKYSDFFPPYFKTFLENSPVLHLQAESSQSIYTLETNQDLILTKNESTHTQINFPGVGDCHVVVVQNLKSGDVYFGHISPSGNLENLEAFLENADDAQFAVQIYYTSYASTNADSTQKLRSIKLLLQNTKHTFQVRSLADTLFDVTLSIDEGVKINSLHTSTQILP